ncbi:gp34 [Mycobacterium phage Che9c]|uniref:Uncharacterized protein n=1 Tax=Mycobacterium phage Che9c TaxID=2907832 RepID=Q854W3_9CAUD|nr:gp34 [Mycobacterium phage Che9c]AAN12595.1 hypothetical protein PBI_CHE9C_34 [Mycobacterium phage Che9c]
MRTSSSACWSASSPSRPSAPCWLASSSRRSICKSAIDRERPQLGIDDLNGSHDGLDAAGARAVPLTLWASYPDGGRGIAPAQRPTASMNSIQSIPKIWCIRYPDSGGSVSR